MVSGKPIQYVEYDTRGTPSADAFEQWRSRGMCGGGLICELSGDVSRFFVNQKGSASASSSVMKAEMSALTYERRAGQARRDGIDWIWVEYHTGGLDTRNTLSSERGEFFDTQGSVIITDLARPYLRRAAEANFISATLDRSLFTEDEIASLHGVSIVGARARMIGDFLRVLAKPDEGRDHVQLHSKIATVISAVVASSADRAAEAAAQLAPLALTETCRFIDRNLHREGLDLSEVVAASQVSRPTLYRLFKPYGGLARYMWSRRLERARTALTHGDKARSVVEIAEAVGFSDPAHFSRAFKAEFGLKPSDLR